MPPVSRQPKKQTEGTMEYFKRCPSCGAKNNSSRSSCECGADLTKVKIEAVAVEGGKASAVFSGERPGCLTAYVVLLYGPGIVGGILAAVAGIASMLIDLMARSNSSTGTGIFLVFFGILMALFCYWIARGFWDMRSWARYWALIQHGLSVPGSISLATPILAGLANGDTRVILVTAALSVIGLGFAALNGYTVYWFAVNGKYFS
jgi:hypothetical protein